MTKAAESQAGPMAVHEPGSAESAATSRFTAVNGREPVAGQAPVATGGPTASINGNGHRKRDSDDRPPTQHRTTPPGAEKLTITTTTPPREDWQHPANGDRQSSMGGHLYRQASSYTDSESSHKRKRSDSADRHTAQPSSSSSYHSHGLPSSKPPDSGVGTDSPDTPREASIRPRSHHATRDPYVHHLQTHYPQYNDETRENGSAGGAWYTQQHQDVRPSQESPQVTHHMSPEDQLREALQRDAQSLDGQSAYPQGSPGDDDDQSISYQGGYAPDRMPLQMNPDHKKRKRNFSNRTKTGCMTCRRRKKKCDETRPECNNCIRGGFVCNGYPTRGPWPKTEQKQAPVPLQSKEGYENSHGQYVQPSPYASQAASSSRREPLPGYRGQQLRVDPQHTTRPMGLEDDRPSASTMPSGTTGSPENRMSALYSQTAPFPTPVSASPGAYPDRLSQHDYKRVPPLHDPTRIEHETGTPQSAQSSVPHINILHPSHGNSPHPHTQQPSTVQNTAQLALSHPASTGRPPTQKEEMLSGRHYFPFDRELVLERERCNAACWRFNSSTNPNNGVSQEERARQFRDILQPNVLINISPTHASRVSPSGYVGNNVVVEAPFTCDYGYNIHIGQDVAIGKNCTILDTCEVRIGDRCIIGPNVQIYTATLPIDPKRRLGSRGPNLGKPIVIEEDCWIGGGVIILPGRTIKKGSTVGAGSIVTRDVPPFTVVCGNPARVTRGLYPPTE